MSYLNKPLLFLSLLFSLLWISCETQPYQEQGKVVLLCDDFNVTNWYQYKDSFEKYGIPVSFFVSHFHQMDSVQILKLHQLSEAGNEIAYHTLNHPQLNNEEPIELEAYLKTEIDSGYQLMRLAGFNPQSFAFPGNQSNRQWQDSLKVRFPYVRAGSFGYFEYWKRRRSFELSADKPDSFWCYDIGSNSNFMADDNMLMLLEDVSLGKNIALLFHSIGDSNTIYTTPVEPFFALIRDLYRDGAHFVTVSQFYENVDHTNLHYAHKKP